ncbi:hypothetical protein SAMN05428995_102420 [Loktanella sp. DSM 29012]|uniref:hypothetical protein n=1 Tax=Loktanella sp. DSM 29012 TaxID=1881056 RepID=UPI0008C87204|nr:hypothetical protein [Loktanella sp. DSM 29012]SEQ04756.1 hypothetical protein SAMN05428995_102420 [Loktanella sp. DSM 29012]
MYKATSAIALVAIMGVAGCDNLDTDAERAIVGAGIGAAGSAALGGDDRDTTTAALGGALVGALGDDITGR